MKRIFAFVFVFCLCLCVFCPASVSAVKDGKRFYVESTENADGTYAVNVCWEGAEEEDSIGALRLTLSYPNEKLVCKSHKLGAAMRDFGIKVGPQYVYSNPAYIVGVEINHPVTSEGVLGEFVFEPAAGASGTAELKLEILELNRMDSTSAKEDFAVESGAIELSLACSRDTSLHEDLPWQVEGEKLIRLCPHCGARVAEKGTSSSHAPIEQENAVITPGSESLPEDVVIEVKPISPAPEQDGSGETDVDDDAILSWIKTFLGSDVESITLVAKYEVGFLLDGEAFLPAEDSTLTLSVPAGLKDGSGVYVALVCDGVVKDVVLCVVKEGTVTFPMNEEFDSVYFCTSPLSEKLPLTESELAPIPEGDVSEGTEEGEDPQTTPEAVEDASAFPWIWILLGIVAVAAVGVTVWTVTAAKKKEDHEQQ